MPETIELQKNRADGRWDPAVGEETLGLLRSNSKLIDTNGNLNDSGQRVLDETLRIMQVCGDPRGQINYETGIVIGYVQSGKTLSFTALTALARDNNYQIVIVIAGTSVNLLDQSTSRLRRDLRIDARYGFEQRWTQIKNPHTQEDFDTIESLLEQWSDVTFPKDRCRTVLITVMKNGSHLRNLTALMSSLSLEGVPTLIIDDEGDQASLNTRARWAAREGIDLEVLTENEVSTIYRRITALRAIFPHHTFLQYTATPQANLFINIMDRLSPNFIKLLTPGDEYTGGIEFFRENKNLIHVIPPNDLPIANYPLTEPPESLLEALRIFYLGVVAGTVMQTYRFPNQHNRSMLIHPSRLQGDHTTFFRWVNSIKDSWTRLFSSADNDEKNALIEEFRNAYDNLLSTVGDLPEFERLTDRDLVHAIQYTPIVEVNSRRGSTPQINWQDSYSWILVGGQSMDRGFTVEGLTITYMPRNVGVGNVDTVQQRARFFGYRSGYLNYCRVFLDQATTDTYHSIIEHEEDVRNRLEEFDINNKHLNDWDREVVLDQMLNLTRANILYDDIDRDRFGNDWFRINAPHDTEALITANRDALLAFLQTQRDQFTINVGDPRRTDDQKHLVVTLPLRVCLENLLYRLRFTRETDSATYSSLRGILKRYLAEHPEELCQLYLMSANSIDDWKIRTRRLDRNDEIQQLFQGRNPRTGEIVYPGDSEIKEQGTLSIQIHRLRIVDVNGQDIADEAGSAKFTDVTTLAIWVPEHIGRDIARQV